MQIGTARRRRAAYGRAGLPLTRGLALARLAVVIVALVGGLLLSGCGPSADQGASASGSPTAASGGSQATPEEIGAAVSALYQQAMSEVAGLMGPRPDGATLRPQVEGLKATYVERLVALGKQREALSAGDRATVDAKITTGIDGLSPELYAAYRESQAHYRSQDLELGNLIASFNIIAQYANYDLVRSQEPEEAARLGL